MLTTVELLVLSSLVLVFAFALAWVYRSLRQAIQDRNISMQVTALTDRVDHIDDQLNAIRRELAGLKEASSDVAPSASEAESSYAAAMRLAQKGMDSAEVAAGCGISRGEAELIVALYRASHRS